MGKSANASKINVVKLAHLHFQEGRWDKAIEEYRKLLEMDSSDLNVHNMLGDVYAKKNDFTNAYKEYKLVAADFMNRGQKDKAAQIHEKITRLDKSRLSPEDQRTQELIQLRLKADTALDANKIEEALGALEEILKLEPKDIGVISKLAELEEKSGETSSAVKRYAQLGESFLKSHLYKKAEEVFKKVVEIDPQNRQSQVSLAHIHEKQGNESDAKKDYLNIATQALANSDLDAAFEYAGKAVELKSIEAHFIVGVVWFKRQKWAEAKSAFDNLLRFKVNHSAAQVYLAKVYEEMGQLEKAVETFKKAMKLDKESIFALEAWAEYCLKIDDKDETIKTLKILIDKVEAAGNFSNAVEWARKMVSVDKDQTASKLKLAQLLQSKGNKDEAADVYRNLALICAGKNRQEEAALYTKKALELNADHPKKLNAILEYPSREIITAGEDITTIQVLTETSLTNNGLGNTEAVLDKVEMVHDGPDADQVNVLNLAPTTETTVEISPFENMRAQMGIGDQYVKQGLLDEAIFVYQQLLELDSEDLEVRQKLNNAYSAYAKTGTDLTKIFEVESQADVEIKKAGLESAKRKLKEIEIKAKKDSEKMANAILLRKTDDEVKKMKVASAKRTLRELENIAKSESIEMIKAVLEGKRHQKKIKKTRQAAELTTEERVTIGLDTTTMQKVEKSQFDGNLDEMVAIAEADLLYQRGRNADAAKMYAVILETKPNNEEVRRKLTAAQERLNDSLHEPFIKVSAPSKPMELPVVKTASFDFAVSKNQKTIRKNSNKIGYV